MFKIEMDKPEEFKSAVDALGNLIDEGTFSIRKEGLGLHALDPSQIAMVIFSMPSGAFSAFEVDGPQSVGLNLDNLGKILSRGKGGKLSLFDDENRVVVQFESGNSKKSFKVPIIELAAGVEREPKVEHDAHIVMSASALKDAVRDIALVSSHITFEAKGKKLRMVATGDSADAEIEYEHGDDGCIKRMEVKSPVKATFPVQYLEDMVKGASDTSDVEIGLRTNAPIKLKYDVGNARFLYYLAPRIDLE
ncbi:MAG: proliferating cell nuclear antigen (pcna) [Candidatus Micrarchaeota archaeon]|nr:proliferating cell nuclear antigen (pcna) [Candidatus Micrarchaeota archaeon]